METKLRIRTTTSPITRNQHPRGTKVNNAIYSAPRLRLTGQLQVTSKRNQALAARVACLTTHRR
jgi:hypothetical protein